MSDLWRNNSVYHHIWTRHLFVFDGSMWRSTLHLGTKLMQAWLAASSVADCMVPHALQLQAQPGCLKPPPASPARARQGEHYKQSPKDSVGRSVDAMTYFPGSRLSIITGLVQERRLSRSDKERLLPSSLVVTHACVCGERE